MKRFLFFLTFCFLIAVSGSDTRAQCALCKSSAESSLREGDPEAKGLNSGIMYLLMMPYLLVGGLGYYWYVNQKKHAAEANSEGL